MLSWFVPPIVIPAAFVLAMFGYLAIGYLR
jgi:hypothetical protein